MKQYLMYGGLPMYELGILAVVAESENEAVTAFKKAFPQHDKQNCLVIESGPVGMPIPLKTDIG